MKVNCRALKISILISSSLLVLTIVFTGLNIKFQNNIILEFIKEILLGFFCSSVVTIFFYTSAYKVEKIRLLERYWNEIRKLLNELYKIEYLNVEYDEKIIVNYIHEESHGWIREYNKMNPDNKIKEDLTYTNLLKEELKKENIEVLSQLTNEGKKKFINEKLDKIYKNITEKMNKVIDQYENLLENSTENLNFMLGNMQFFSKNDNYKKAYELYKDLNEIFKKIQTEIIHFRYYKDGEGNKAVVLQKLLELQKSIFRVEEEQSKEFNSKLIYNEFNDKMHKKLEDFRAKIIYNVEPEYIREIPILQINDIRVNIDEK